MTIKFVNLHGHSTFSVFDGFAYPDKHIDAAIEKGMNAIALTDHGNMNGLAYQVLHTKKLKKSGVDFKPIFGVEAYFIDSYEDWKKEFEEEITEDDAELVDEEDRKSNKKKYAHLVLLAKNLKGYNNLCKIVSESHGKYFYRKPRVDFKLLSEHSEGIIALSACLAGSMAKLMWDYLDKDDLSKERDEFIDELIEKSNKFKEIFGDNWYLELQWNAIPEQHKYNQYLIEVAQKTGTKLVSTCDAHYPKREDWEAREIYKKLGWLGANFTPEWAKELTVNKDELKYELYVKNGDELFSEYKRYSDICNASYDEQLVLESIERTQEIADNIEAFYPDTKAKFPKFVIEEGKEAKDVLTSLCEEQLIARNLDNEEYRSRLVMELETIISKGFAEYFLTMKKISDFASSNFLTGPGRGSAAGSLVSYLLNITQVDPIKHHLLFSRFLRKDSDGYPDIDYDVSERDKLVLLLTKNWGENCVIPITNWNTLSIKSLTKDLAKLYEIPFQEVNEVTKIMDDEAVSLAKEEAGVKAGVYKVKLDEYIKHSEAFSDFLEKYPDIEKYLRLLEGQIRSQSRHAGGVLVVDNIDEKIPLIRGTSLKKEQKEERVAIGLNPMMYQTPWTEGQNVRQLEPLGFIKFDILGLETLSIIQNTVNLILKKELGRVPTFEEIKNFYNEKLNPDKIDLNDQEVYENVFHKGRWAGIFQFTEHGAQGFCQQVKPRTIEDLSAITAIYRPGPLGAKVHEKYLNAKNNPDRIKYDHPLHKEVSEKTCGFLIYQEQIAMLAHKLGKNISLDEGDLLRKVLTKKGTGKDEVKDKIKEKFISGCLEKGLSENKAEEIWETFILFSGYGFNKCLAKGTFVETKTRGEVLIEEVKIGEEVNSKNGFVKVLNVYKNDIKNVNRYTIRTNSKELFLDCTKDHKIEFFSEIDNKCYMKKISEIVKWEMSHFPPKVITKYGNGIISSVFTPKGSEPTYDLEVDHPEHTFYANGISVSNSHSICYSIVSFICAHLLNYYPDEWLASYMDTQTKPEEKEQAINTIKSLGFKVKEININISENSWVPTYDNSLVQPISFIKGVGEKALEELLTHRPFNSIEELIFHPKMSYRKVNKKIIDALVKSGALNDLLTKDGFTNQKHLWMTIAEEKLTSQKKYKEKYELHKNIADFTDEEKFNFQIDLCGTYPFSSVVDENRIEKLRKINCVPISQYKGGNKVGWGVIKDYIIKKTGKGKDYAVITLIDDSFKEVTVRCWSWNPKYDKIEKHNLYFVKLSYEDKWGLSCRNYQNAFKLIPKTEKQEGVNND